MLRFLVRMKFNETDRDRIAGILRLLSDASRLEPGCVSYIPHFVIGEVATVLIYEQYSDEAALEHHRNTPHFHEYAIGGLYQAMIDRQIEHLTAIA